MTASAFARSLGVAVALASAFLVGCFGDESGGGGGSSGGGYYGGSGGGTASSSGGSGASSQPMLVVVDANQTMSASPGQGVGVFTQYQTGGHWNVWWSCDTSVTSESCNFDVTVSVSTGSIANAAGQTLASSDTLSVSGAQQIEVQTLTTTGIQGVTFDTTVPSGTTPIITLDAKLDGVDDAQYLFFVQDGKINGSFQGTLTDPLMLEPSVP
ncbi:MAG TPA: hypothetical protein VIF09_16500 [Polyangiaceae bacterium]|jgi:hypothetical protein